MGLRWNELALRLVVLIQGPAFSSIFGIGEKSFAPTIQVLSGVESVDFCTATPKARPAISGKTASALRIGTLVHQFELDSPSAWAPACNGPSIKAAFRTHVTVATSKTIAEIVSQPHRGTVRITSRKLLP
jgi:hypothetical protein